MDTSGLPCLQVATAQHIGSCVPLHSWGKNPVQQGSKHTGPEAWATEERHKHFKPHDASLVLPQTSLFTRVLIVQVLQHSRTVMPSQRSRQVRIATTRPPQAPYTRAHSAVGCCCSSASSSPTLVQQRAVGLLDGVTRGDALKVRRRLGVRLLVGNLGKPDCRHRDVRAAARVDAKRR